MDAVVERMSRKGENERRNKSLRAEERRLSWKAWLRRSEAGGWLEKRECGKRQGAASEKRRRSSHPCHQRNRQGQSRQRLPPVIGQCFVHVELELRLGGGRVIDFVGCGECIDTAIGTPGLLDYWSWQE